jgi:glycosyltransferase involved in cell wall biosynthesis
MSDVSVIVPTRDRWPTLLRTMRSALSQREVAVELIVVDDGSTTAPPADPVLSDPRVRMIRHPESRGVAAARNTGVAAAHADWVAWLDDDDLWAPSKVASQLSAARAGNAVLAYAAAVVVDADLRPVETWHAPPPNGLARALVRDVLIPAGSSNVMASRAAVLACGGFDTNLDHLADWDMWLRLAREGAAARYVVHDANRHLAAEGLMEEFDRLSAKHAAWATSVGTSFDRARFSRYPIRLLVDRGQRREAMMLAARYCLRRPTLSNLRTAASGLAGSRIALRSRQLRQGRSLQFSPLWLTELGRQTDG